MEKANINGIAANINQSDSDKLAILLPGHLDTKDYIHLTMLAEDLNKIGYLTISFDPTGIWESDGNIEQYNLTQYLIDVDTVINHASEKNKYTEIILLGHSFGGRVAIEYAANHSEIKQAVAIMTPSDTHNSPYIKARRIEWRKAGKLLSKRNLPENVNKFKEFLVPYSFVEDRSKYNLLNAIAKFHGKTIVIAGELDEVAIPNDVKKIYEAANEPKYFTSIPGIGHNYRHDPDNVKIVNKEIIKLLQS